LKFDIVIKEMIIYRPPAISKTLLFLFFINDIIDDIFTDTADGIVTLNDYLIYLILFADDTVLFGKTPEILQHLLVDTKSNGRIDRLYHCYKFSTKSIT
jgi:hypothetical protein